jgi:hypothetical protein
MHLFFFCIWFPYLSLANSSYNDSLSHLGRNSHTVEVEIGCCLEVDLALHGWPSLANLFAYFPDGMILLLPNIAWT